MAVCPYGSEWNGSYLNGVVDPSGYIVIGTRDKLITAYSPQAAEKILEKFTDLYDQPQDVISVDELCESYPVVPSGDFSDLYTNFSVSGAVLLALRKQQLFHRLCRCLPKPVEVVGSCETPVFDIERRCDCWFLQTKEQNTCGSTPFIDTGYWEFLAYGNGSEVWTWENEAVSGSPSTNIRKIYRDGELFVDVDTGDCRETIEVCFAYRSCAIGPGPLQIVYTDDVNYPGGDDDVQVIYLPGPPGDPGPAGPPGPPGQDATVETEDITIPKLICENGIELISDTVVSVLKPTTGSTALLWQLLFEVLTRIAKDKICNNGFARQPEVLADNVANGSYYGLLNNAEYVVVESQIVFEGRPREYGYSEADTYDDVFEIGWVSFYQGFTYGELMPIQKTNQRFDVPDWAEGVEVLIRFGWQSKVSVVYKNTVPDNPV